MERGHDKGEDGGGGSAGPPFGVRVAALEARIDRVEAGLQRIEVAIAELTVKISALPTTSDYAALRAEVAEIKGRLSNMPTTWTLMSFTIGACLASAGLAFAIARMIAP